MILLSFSARNFGSIRDEMTLDLMRPQLRTLKPKDGDWASVTYPLAGIFGGNATGKSTVVEAIGYAMDAIALSSTEWQARRAMPRRPFALDGEFETSSSAFEFDFVHQGIRHRYGFEIDAEGVREEWLDDLPASRWRKVFSRTRHGSTGLSGGLRDITDRELVLSRARLKAGFPFHELAQDLVHSFDAVWVKDSHRDTRLKHIADSLVDGSTSFEDLEALLQVADIGVTKVGVEEHNLPERIRKMMQVVRRELGDESGQNTPEDEADEDERALIVRNLTFTHRGSVEDVPAFPLPDESDGTVAWLALAVPALDALRGGGLLVVDEIDASLHPHLVALLISAFADPEVNRHHAQMVFTTHETYLLSPSSSVRLDAKQVWFTDKSAEGVTELACLADFRQHPDANVAKRYLAGRYGGTPYLSPSLFSALARTEVPV